jgi:hypothetical protein
MCGTKKALRTLTALTFLSVLAALGCGTYSPVAPSNSSMPGLENPEFATLLSASKVSDSAMRSALASAMVSAKDGGVVSNGFYSVYFAPGALEKDTEISIEMPEFPKAVVRLSPHGIQFNAPVVLTLSVDMISAPASDYRVLWLNEVTGLWENVGGCIENGAVKANLLHFSEYGPEPTTSINP